MSFQRAKQTANAVHRVHSAESQAASATALFENKGGNIFGFYVEENSGSADAFLCLYDAATAASVTPGSTPVTASYRIKGGQGFGKDPVSSALHHFKDGCSYVIAENRDGSTPKSGDTIKVWFEG
jgi:hypothetical protein